MKRKILAYFMAFTILFFNLFFTYEDAKANPLLPVLGALEIGDLVFGTSSVAAVTALFASQGVTCAKPTDTRSLVADALYHYPDAVRRNIAAWPETQLFKARAAVKISQAVWDASMDYINKLKAGVDQRKSMEVSISSDGKVSPITFGTKANPYSYVYGGKALQACIDGNFVYTRTYADGDFYNKAIDTFAGMYEIYSWYNTPCTLTYNGCDTTTGINHYTGFDAYYVIYTAHYLLKDRYGTVLRDCTSTYTNVQKYTMPTVLSESPVADSSADTPYYDSIQKAVLLRYQFRRHRQAKELLQFHNLLQILGQLA